MLQQLAEENILIIGSGFSFHNLQAFFGPTNAEDDAKNQAFEEWLLATLSTTESTERNQQKLELYRLKQTWQLPFVGLVWCRTMRRISPCV